MKIDGSSNLPLSEPILRQLIECKPGVTQFGFKITLAKLLEENDTTFNKFFNENMASDFGSFVALPDAHRLIQNDRYELEIYEIVVTNRISDKKAEFYRLLDVCLSQFDIITTLHVIDESGAELIHSPEDYADARFILKRKAEKIRDTR